MSKQTQTAIVKTIADCKVGDLFTITLAPTTNAIWIRKDGDGDDAFLDAAGDQIYSHHMAAIATGKTLDVKVYSRKDDGRVSMSDEEDCYMWITPGHLQSITPRVSPIKTIKIGELAYDMAFNTKTGVCKVGCQTLTRSGCQQVFVALAAHLGYELSE